MKKYEKKKENKINKYKIVTIIFLIIIIGMMISVIKNGYENMVDEAKNVFIDNKLSKYDKIERITNQTEDIINNSINNKDQLINIYGLIQNIIGKKVIEDKNDRTKNIVKLKNNMLTFLQEEQPMNEKADKISEFNEKLNNLGIPLIYIQAPYKLELNNDLPIGIKDYANQNADKLLEILKEKNVHNIDLRTVLRNKNMEEKFFYTDHHWRIETAFEASNYISDELNKNFEFGIDEYYMNIKNYKIITSNKEFLGSIGKRIGKYYAGTDKFNYIIPDFMTDMIVDNKSKSKTLAGSFENTVLDENFLEGQNIIDNQYACYFGGDFPEIIINNKNPFLNKKILVIQDSFGLPFSAMMSLRVKELHILDLRHYNDSEMNYIKEYNPDMVMVIYNPSSFYIEKLFEFE